MQPKAFANLRNLAHTAERGGWILETWTEQSGGGYWATVFANVDKQHGQDMAATLPIARLRPIPAGKSNK